MDRISAYKLIQQQAQLATWPGGISVFGSVLISAAPVEWVLSTRRLPALLIRPVTSQSDPVRGEEPNLLVETVEMVIVAAVEGDELGRGPVIGGAGSDIPESTLGHGIIRLSSKLQEVVRFLNAKQGLTIQWRSMSGHGTTLAQDLGWVAWESHLYEMAIEHVAGVI